MSDKLYLLLLGLARPFDACSAALSEFGISYMYDEDAELWPLGTHQAVFLGRLRGTPSGLLRGRFSSALKHPDIESAIVVEAGDWIAFGEAGKSIAARISARSRDSAGTDLSMSRRPSSRSRRRVHIPAAGPPSTKE